MTVDESPLAGALQGVLLTPSARCGLGVVVLSGSSGRIDVSRARLFAERGAVVIAMRWFGGEGQPTGILEIPLESFGLATDRLQGEHCTRIAFVGTSRGAEAALLVAAHDPRIDIVVATSPSSVVWANADPRPPDEPWSQRSSFTLAGEPLPFVAFDEPFLLTMPRDPPIAYLGLFQRSLETHADRLTAAAIPIERSEAAVVLVAGGDDALWPSAWFAGALAARLASGGKRAAVITHPAAGHRVLLPGETTLRSSQNAHGGTDDANRELGRAAWATIARALGFER